MKRVTVLIPVYNEEGSLQELCDRLQKVFLGNNFDGDILFVNDGSSDNTGMILDNLKQNNENIAVIHFSHNRGKADALQSGFNAAEGDYVITMDGDLQDDPDELPGLIAKIDSGWDVVSGWKKERHDPLGKTLPSKFFNKTTSMFTGIKIHDFNCGLKAYKKEVV
ncbi:MAG: glycosyltransferase family 2 protein, partial [Candidatus Marinimicrobia bacterium]|nr:glycosyltransferase family 2 protein [Candidatus Neomarinimicrobiota bacterium]